ncbi:DUF4190 domain-containing protein [Amycolatopsis sp. PS_44_ISF1]|uniref:DUF4190 domain-containing protein n=1 Tax=Amycolatopsis sp. PS_44_ISF1 TaxID=2974917 RepID=UPI0028DDE1D1|nr:DUF4190 domain-containing protein [Amycolatopsis sp. PS_44_ISF1]MDT8912468.1 DUF4190 domain-containing protein [Amycolatopsis sp. PS_44_ISF1]
MSTPDEQSQQQYPMGQGQGQSGSYPAPPVGYDQQQPVAPRNGFGVTALVLGILAIVLCWTVWGGIVLGVLALIFGILGIKRANRREATNKGAAVAGVVTGVIGLIIGIILAVVVGSIFAIFGDQISSYQDCVNQAGGDQAKVQQCQQQLNNDVSNKN